MKGHLNIFSMLCLNTNDAYIGCPTDSWQQSLSIFRRTTCFTNYFFFYFVSQMTIQWVSDFTLEKQLTLKMLATFHFKTLIMVVLATEKAFDNFDILQVKA